MWRWRGGVEEEGRDLCCLSPPRSSPLLSFRLSFSVLRSFVFCFPYQKYQLLFVFRPFLCFWDGERRAAEGERGKERELPREAEMRGKKKHFCKSSLFCLLRGGNAFFYRSELLLSFDVLKILKRKRGEVCQLR
jgi:hypothetical protein